MVDAGHKSEPPLFFVGEKAAVGRFIDDGGVPGDAGTAEGGTPREPGTEGGPLGGDPPVPLG